MKIAHVICTFPPYKGGMGNSAWQFARYTARLPRQTVSVFTPAYTANSLVEEEIEGVSVQRLKPNFAYGNAAVLWSLWSKLDDFDVVHLHYPFFGTAEIVALKKRLGAKFKLVIHYHMDTAALGWKGLVFKTYRYLLLNWILNSAEMITCASLDYVKHADLAKYYTKSAGRFAQVPFGVDADFFAAGQSHERQKQFLFVGGLDRAHYFKGVDVLLKAFALLDQSLGFKLLIVGRGELQAAYQKLAQDLQIADKVEFINDAGNRRLAELYRSSQALILPSVNRGEAFGLVLLEAMASGTPVVATNLPGVRSVFKNGQQGFLVQPGDSEALAKRLWQLSKQDRNWEKMSEACRQLVEERYTWQAAAQNLNNVYHRVKYSPNTNNNTDYEGLSD